MHQKRVFNGLNGPDGPHGRSNAEKSIGSILSIWSIKCRLLTKTEFQAGNHCELLPQTAGEALFFDKIVKNHLIFGKIWNILEIVGNCWKLLEIYCRLICIYKENQENPYVGVLR